MAPDKDYSMFLSIGHGHKGIPYGGSGELRPDGHANYGFQNLKGDPSLISSVPELKDDAPLRMLITAINKPENGLFSIGCVSGDFHEEQGSRRGGYVEFAINSKAVVNLAGRYFPLFFHFDEFLRRTHFSQRVCFNWELEPATFIDANVGGLTCSIWINTLFFPSDELAKQCWAGALGALTVFLSGYGIQEGEAIYSPPGATE